MTNKKFILQYSFLLSLSLFLVFSCNKNAESTDTDTDSLAFVQKKIDSSKQDSLKKIQEQIKYTAMVFPDGKKDSAMDVFLEKYTAEQRYLVLAINRLDNANKWRADTLIIPDKFEDNFLRYAPFPAKVEALKDVHKMAFFSYLIHAYGLYENGILVKWGPSSMGKKSSQTKRGLMFTNWKKEVAISTVNSSWKLRWNFNIHNTLGIGWHQYDLPGFHASHSCLRLLEEDANWMYNWAEQWVLTNQGQTVAAKGTPVYVFGESDFKSKPWLDLLNDPKANDITEKEIADWVAPELEVILKEQKNSGEIRGDQTTQKAPAPQMGG